MLVQSPFAVPCTQVRTWSMAADAADAADAAITRYLAAFLSAHRHVAIDDDSPPSDHDPARPASQVSAIVYGATKAAVSMLTVQYARAVPEVRFNAVEPGYTATELGGRSNDQGRPVEISARTIVRMAGIGSDGPTGTFQEDDGVLGW